jgi:dihydroneopterin aldolase
MTDRIVLQNIRVDGRHGVLEDERASAQPFEVDVELVLDLRPAGSSDDLTRTIDYRDVDATVRRIIRDRSYQLLETIAETIASEILASDEVDEVVIRVRKPEVRLGGPIDFAGVEIRRRRQPAPGDSTSA